MPLVVRWPGVIEPGSISNNTISHLDWLPTIMAAVGEPDIKTKLKQSYAVGDKTFKVHLDGYNLLPYWKGKLKKVRAVNSSISPTPAIC